MLEPQLEEQRRLLERLSDLLCAQGLSVLPYRDPALPFLQSKKGAEKGIHYLRLYLEVLEGMVRDGISPRDTRQLLWRYLQRLELRPQADIFGLLEDENVVELYTLDNLQVFRNLKFFEYSSMTVEECVHCDWSKVTKRSALVTLKLLGLAVKFKAGLIRETLDTHSLGDNLVQETIGENRKVYVHVRYISPLAGPGGRREDVVMSVNRVRHAGA